MSGYIEPITRVETAKGHHYTDGNGRRVPGVTTVTDGGLPKKALIDWAGNSTAAYAVDNWDELAKLPPTARLKRIQGGRYEDKDRAANRGTEVHALAEKLITGEEVKIPEEIAGHAESYVHFLDEFDPQPILIEGTVYSIKHGYAGTLDLIADFPTIGKRLLVDLKTNRSGIFGETALQLAGYRYAEKYVDSSGAALPMLEVDGCAAIHVRADGFDLIPLTVSERQFRQFLYAQQIKHFADESRDLVGAPIAPPSRVQRRRLEIVRQEATA